MKNILIEGWRGICQSLAMVNQYQILELIKSPKLSICHSDLPYHFPRWAESGNEPGFPLVMEDSIMAIPEPSTGAFDAVYRIGFPYARSSVPAKRTLTFIVAEFGLDEEKFTSGNTTVDRFCTGDDLVVTPSNWSKMKLLEYGFPAEKIRVIPHGVNNDIYFPLLQHERECIRHDLDISNEHFVFLNVSGLSPNKGVNFLLLAFSCVRQRYPHAKLILKDTSGLYGTTVANFVLDHMNRFGPLPPEVLESIYQVPSGLPLAEMRLLYGGADAYVSPYTAEGFNLPVIEAIACGTPVIVTKGGATDDYCDARDSLMIESVPIANSQRGSSVPGHHLEPCVESLVEQMEKALTESLAASDSFKCGRRELVEKFSWASVTRQLESIF